MTSMSLVPSTVPACGNASQECMARAERLIRVKFVGLPFPDHDAAVAEPLSSPLSLLTRVFGRLWAARP
jgi:hypothetical protein